MLGGGIFGSLFLSAAATNFSALPSKIFDPVDKIEKSDLVAAFGKARSRAAERLVGSPVRCLFLLTCVH